MTLQIISFADRANTRGMSGVAAIRSIAFGTASKDLQLFPGSCASMNLTTLVGERLSVSKRSCFPFGPF
jgi:hypothetical protein